MKGAARNESLKRESHVVEARSHELDDLLADQVAEPVLLHPNVADRYRREVVGLIDASKDETHRHEAVDLIRRLIEKVVLTPDSESAGLVISLNSDLAGILNVATGKEKQDENDMKRIKLAVGMDSFPSTPGWAQGKMVGPAGLEPATRPL